MPAENEKPHAKRDCPRMPETKATQQAAAIGKKQKNSAKQNVFNNAALAIQNAQAQAALKQAAYQKGQGKGPPKGQPKGAGSWGKQKGGKGKGKPKDHSGKGGSKGRW